jgi:hypothetical protein
VFGAPGERLDVDAALAASGIVARYELVESG